MRVFVKTLIPLLAAIVLFPVASFAITTSGMLLGDETWSGTVAVTGDVTVPAGATLTVLPGTVVAFAALSDDQRAGRDINRAELLVKGSLIAEGTVDNPILFTSNAAGPARFDWYGIRLDAATGPASLKIAQAVVEYAYTGIWSSAGAFAMNVTLSDVVVRHHQYNGVEVSANAGSDASVTITNGTVTDCNQTGIAASAGDTAFPMRFTVTGTTVTSNGYNGITLNAGTRGVIAEISETVVTGNNFGISTLLSYCSAGATSSITIRNNEVSSNTKTGIYLNEGECDLDVKITDNRVYGHSENGILLLIYAAGERASGIIRANEIYENGYGIKISNGTGSPVEITGNRIHNNAHGIDEWSAPTAIAGLKAELFSQNDIYENGTSISRAGSPPADFLYNNIHDNTGSNLYLNGGNGTRLAYNNLFNSAASWKIYSNAPTAIDARRNYWGEPMRAQMEAGGNPKSISGMYGQFEYAGWLTAPEPIPFVPLSRITWPASESVHNAGALSIQGVAVAPGGVALVEISADDGQSWSVAQGTAFWSFDWRPSGDGTFNLLTRVTDDSGLQETSGAGISVNIDHALPTTSGALSVNETWSGTIQLQGDVTVPAGMALTILPGTTVVAPTLADATVGGLDGFRTELIVEGTLFAEGTTVAPILLTSGGGQAGDWYGVRVNGAAHLKGVVVEKGQTGVSFTADAATDELLVRESTIQNNAVNGIAIAGSGAADILVRVENSTVSGNAQNGILVDKQGAIPLQPVFSGNTIANNGKGINYTCAPSATHTDALTISGNTMANNGGMGISYSCWATVAQSVALTVVGNTLSDHSQYGILVDLSNSISSQVTIENNMISRSGTNLGIWAGTVGPSTLNVSGNVLSSGNYGGWVYAAEGHGAANALIFRDNVVEGNAEGIWCAATGAGAAPRIEGNTVSGNGRGIYVMAGGEAHVSGNTLAGNDTYDLYNDSVALVDARGNWWGALTTSEMNTEPYPSDIDGIFDTNDDASKGTVVYVDWLNAFARPPEPTLAAVSSPTGASSQSLSGTKAAGTAIVLNSVEVVAAGPETTWIHALPLSEGANDIHLLARNAAELASTIVSATIVRDTTPPRVYASTPAAGETLPREVQAITLALADDATAIDPTASLAGATVRDGGDADVAGAWSVEDNNLIFTPAAPLGPGSYTVTVHPTDAPLGNAATAVVAFSIDLVAPAAPALDPLPAATNISSYPLFGTKESGTSIWMDGVQVVALDGSTSWTYALALREGANAHALVSRDSAGNQSPEARFGIVLDSYPPFLDGTIPVPGSYVNARPENVVFSYGEEGTAIDPVTTPATAVLKDSSNQIVPGSWTLSAAYTVVFTPAAPFAEDSYTASLTASDLAGNSRLTNLSFTYDATPPADPVLNPVTSPTAFAVQTLSGTKSANSGIWINDVQVLAVTTATTWTYSYRLATGLNSIAVTARDRAGNTSGEVAATIEYSDTAPLPVSNLTASGDNIGTTVTLFWWDYDEQGQGDVAQYRIYVLDYPFFQVSGLTPTATVNAGILGYSVTGLTKGATYWCAVVAVDTQDNSLTTVSPISVVPQDRTAPENVTNLLVQSLDQQLVFTWSPSADTQGDLAGYNVYFGADPAVSLPKTQLTFDRTGLEEGAAYTCQVVSVDGDGNESPGESLVGVTLMANPANVAVLPWSGYATVSWDPASPAGNVKHYAVYVEPTPFTSVDALAPRAIATGTTANIAGLTNGTPYHFAVTTVNISDGERKTVTTVGATPVTDTTGPILSNVRFDGSPLAGGAVLTRTGAVTLDAVDGSGVARVEFAVDGATRYTGYSAPYAFTWDIAAIADGPHTLAVTAFDTLGHSTPLSFAVTIALAPPPAPSITSPAAGITVSTASVTVEGTALRDTTIALSVNGQAAGSTVATAAGTFNLVVALNEGSNLLQAVAANRASAGPPSAEVLVTRDSSIPAPPTQLAALAKPARVVHLSWSAPSGVPVQGYHIYRADAPFTDIGAAIRVNTATVTSTIHDDTPPTDATFFYRLVSVNAAGTPSELSEQVSAAADDTLPRAVSVAYTPTIFDPGTARAGLGDVTVLLTVSEPLLTTPF